MNQQHCHPPSCSLRWEGVWLSGLLLVFLLISPNSVFAQMKPDPLSNNTASSNTSMIEVAVPIINNRIVWADVATEIAEQVKLDRELIAKMFPKGSLDLSSPTTVLALVGIDLALGDAMSIHVSKDRLGESTLNLRCDRHALGWIKPKQKRVEVECLIDNDWQQRTGPLPLVVCLHGLKSNPARFDAFRAFLRREGYATAAIRYDDNDAIAESARRVSDAVSEKLSHAPEKPSIVLVGHSMGGLVAREWTENILYARDGLTGESIVGLITVGTPHQGSNWAAMPPLLDLFALDDFDASDIIDVLLHQPSAPGLRDLIPGSELLTQMNARPRRTDVRYLCIAGEGSPLSEVEVNRLREVLLDLDRQNGFVRAIRPRIEPLLGSFSELIRGKGDGVVSVSSATLPDSGPPVVVDRSHIDFFNPTLHQPVWQAIAKQLHRWQAPQ